MRRCPVYFAKAQMIVVVSIAKSSFRVWSPRPDVQLHAMGVALKDGYIVKRESTGSTAVGIAEAQSFGLHHNSAHPRR